MTAQEIFTTVKKHLLKQNAKALDYDGGCAYRTYEGQNGMKMCAVGCLLPDSLYSAEMEGKSVKELMEDCPSVRAVFGDHLDLLDELQRVHDNSMPDRWKDELEEVAFIRGLKY